MGIEEKAGSTLILLSLLFGLSQLAIAADAGWSPKADQIARLEKKLVLPPGTRRLGDYGRYYWGTTEKGAKVIRGELDFGQPLGIHIVDQPPRGPTDQGCNRIYIWYELAKDKVSAQCDGVG